MLRVPNGWIAITCEPGAVFNRGLTCVLSGSLCHWTREGLCTALGDGSSANVPVWLGELPAMQHGGLPCRRATSRLHLPRHTGQAEKCLGRHNQRAWVVVDSDDAQCVGLENETDSPQTPECPPTRPASSLSSLAAERWWLPLAQRRDRTGTVAQCGSADRCWRARPSSTKCATRRPSTMSKAPQLRVTMQCSEQ
jgi:hypothetical protein